MSLDRYLELGIAENHNLIGVDSLNDEQLNALKEEGAIYIYKSKETKQRYEGLTSNFIKDHKRNFNDSNNKFLAGKFDKVVIVFTRFFSDDNFSFEEYNRLRKFY